MIDLPRNRLTQHFAEQSGMVTSEMVEDAQQRLYEAKQLLVIAEQLEDTLRRYITLVESDAIEDPLPFPPVDPNWL